MSGFFAYWWYLIAQEMEYGVASHAALLAVVLQAGQRSRLPLVPPSLPSIQVGLVLVCRVCVVVCALRCLPFICGLVESGD